MRKELMLGMLAMLTACQTYNPPTPRVTTDSVYTSAHATCHGAWYEGLDSHVVSVDLLTKGASFDSAYYISGTGWNLYLSDIFIPASDTVLVNGRYEMDTTGCPMTWLPGRDYEGNVSGCYLLQLTEGLLNQVILLTGGMMEVQHKGDSTLIDMVLYSVDSTRYAAHYRGIMPYD